MDSNSTWICRLCLKTSNNLFNIFETFQDTTIASVLTQHFWFQVDKNDGYPECLCNVCWMNVKTFHNFYKRVQRLHGNYSVKMVGIETRSDFNKQEEIVSVREAALEPDLNIVKCEETELQEQMIEMPIEQEETSSYDDDNSCDQSNFLLKDVGQFIFVENAQASDDDDQIPKKKTKNDGIDDSNGTEKKTSSPGIKCESSSEDDFDEFHQSSNTQPTSQSEKDKEDAQIRDFFSMKCDICNDVEFETLSQASKHYRIVHKKKRGHLTCCGKKYFSRCQVLDHVKHHLNPNAFHCDPCGKRFKDAGGLKSHIATHKTFPTNSHKCTLCAKAFSKPSSLAQHKRLQHDVEKDQKFHCEKCSKSYPTKYALASHFRSVHELANAQVCEICAHVCRSKQFYRTHMQEHSGTTQPKVQCDVCGAWLRHEAGLRKHRKRHEDGFVNCPICDRVIQKHSLKDHIRGAHTVNAPRHQCILCDKAFKYPKLLKEHMAVHTGQDLYKCAYCERMFKSNANMYSHRKKAHFAEWSQDRAKSIEAEKTSTSNDASVITTNSH